MAVEVSVVLFVLLSFELHLLLFAAYFEFGCDCLGWGCFCALTWQSSGALGYKYVWEYFGFFKF